MVVIFFNGVLGHMQQSSAPNNVILEQMNKQMASLYQNGPSTHNENAHSAQQVPLANSGMDLLQNLVRSSEISVNARQQQTKGNGPRRIPGIDMEGVNVYPEVTNPNDPIKITVSLPVHECDKDKHLMVCILSKDLELIPQINFLSYHFLIQRSRLGYSELDNIITIDLFFLVNFYLTRRKVETQGW